MKSKKQTILILAAAVILGVLWQLNRSGVLEQASTWMSYAVDARLAEWQGDEVARPMTTPSGDPLRSIGGSIVDFFMSIIFWVIIVTVILMCGVVQLVATVWGWIVSLIRAIIDWIRALADSKKQDVEIRSLSAGLDSEQRESVLRTVQNIQDKHARDIEKMQRAVTRLIREIADLRRKHDNGPDDNVFDDMSSGSTTTTMLGPEDVGEIRITSD